MVDDAILSTEATVWAGEGNVWQEILPPYDTWAPFYKDRVTKPAFSLGYG